METMQNTMKWSRHVMECVTEIPVVDESSEWELLSLLEDWYELKSFEFIVSSIASDAVFFSS